MSDEKHPCQDRQQEALAALKGLTRAFAKQDVEANAAAFNEWMRRYTDEPEKFAADFKTCGEYLRQVGAGEEPGYGETCAAYLEELKSELAGAKPTGIGAVIPEAPPVGGKSV